MCSLRVITDDIARKSDIRSLSPDNRILVRYTLANEKCENNILINVTVYITKHSLEMLS